MAAKGDDDPICNSAEIADEWIEYDNCTRTESENGYVEEYWSK